MASKDSDKGAGALLGISIVGIIGGAIIFFVASNNLSSALSGFSRATAAELATIEAWIAVGVGLISFGALALLFYFHAVAVTSGGVSVKSVDDNAVRRILELSKREASRQRP